MTELDEQPSGGISRRTVTKAMAWAVPVIAIAAPAPAFAVSGGEITFDGLGCKLPGNSNPTYKGYAFLLLVQNTSNTDYKLNIVDITLNGESLGPSFIGVNLGKPNGNGNSCAMIPDPFIIPKNSPQTRFALVTQNASSSSNGTLIATYTVNDGPVQTVERVINTVPPINGNSCPQSTFSKAEKACIGNAIGATIPAWEANHTYNLGDVVELLPATTPRTFLTVTAVTVPGSPNATSGSSGALQPVAPGPGNTVVDGQLTWTQYDATP